MSDIVGTPLKKQIKNKESQFALKKSKNKYIN